MLIIPIGHDQQTVRRLPWVTFAVLAVNLLVFLGTGTAGSDRENAGSQAAQQAVEYWLEHPHLEMPDHFLREVMTPRQVNEFRLLIEVRKNQVPPAADLEDRKREQAELTAIVDRYFQAKEEHPAFAYGLVPSNMSVVALFTSMFMHAGWLHLLGNLFMLYLAGPSVEDAYGRPVFVSLYLVSGVVAALAHVMANPTSAVPLVGASGAIAGVMGAFLIRCGGTNIRFFYWWMLVRAGTFDAPAWLMLPLWLLQQIFMSMLPTGEGGVAYGAHVGGFVFGALAALGIKQWKVEERFIHPKIEKELTLEQHPALAEGLGMLLQGDPVIARQKLAPALRDQPRNPDVHLAYWQTYVHEGQPAKGVDHMAKVIEDELRRKEPILALDHWRELRAVVPAGGPATLRWRLASELQGFDPAIAREALESLAADPEAGLLGEKARLRLGGAPGPVPSAPVPAVSGPIARPVAVEGRVSAPAPPPAPSMPPLPPAGMPAPAPDPVEWEPEMPVVVAGAAPRGVVVEECTIDRLDEGGLVIRGADGAADLLLYSQVEAVAVAGISAAPKPYLLVDLVLSPGTGSSRTVLRLASTRLDPRLLIGMPTLPPMQAFRELVEKLVVSSGARLLPAPEAHVRIAMFPDPDAYQRTVLAEFL
jgi:membrane associated rhomboid family serine protease